MGIVLAFNEKKASGKDTPAAASAEADGLDWEDELCDDLGDTEDDPGGSLDGGDLGAFLSGHHSAGFGED